MDGVLFKDRAHSIFVHPPRPYPDGHGYQQLVDLTAGPFQGTIDAQSYIGVGSLQRFHDELVELYRTLRGQARLGYYNLTIDLVGDGLGHISVRVEATAGHTMETRLSDTFEIDQTQLSPAIDAIAKFPVH